MEVGTIWKMSRSLSRKQEPGSRQWVCLVRDMSTEVSPSTWILFVAEMECNIHNLWCRPHYNPEFGLECIMIDQTAVFIKCFNKVLSWSAFRGIGRAVFLYVLGMMNLLTRNLEFSKIVCQRNKMVLNVRISFLQEFFLQSQVILNTDCKHTYPNWWTKKCYSVPSRYNHFSNTGLDWILTSSWQCVSS